MKLFCDRCGKNIATVFISKGGGPDVEKVQLCAECARLYEDVQDESGLISLLPQILAGIQEEGEEMDAEEFLTGELLLCESCGTTYNDYREMGLLGCARCYEAFGETLRESIHQFQGAALHNGKLPVNPSEGALLRYRMLELERRLKQQVAVEDYEKAAEIRDEIREIGERLSETVSRGNAGVEPE